MIALDTNVLARYYVASPDEASQHQSVLARQLIESGKKLYACKSVVLELEDRLSVAMAIDALADGFDFADALHHASSRQCQHMATFDDKRFARRAALKGWKPSVQVLN